MTQSNAPWPGTNDFKALAHQMAGELYFSSSTSHMAVRKAYATDASMYQELPCAVALPKNKDDVRLLVSFAGQFSLPIIPRTAGTSLAGQVVGNGMVVDMSAYFTEILEVNVAEKWVRVQPGVIRDDLNAFLRPFQLQFGPETSTSNRAMIGGMIGNNSCGLHSLIWGSTRDHLLSVEAVLSDGTLCSFAALTPDQLDRRCQSQGLEGAIYTHVNRLLHNRDARQLVQSAFPASRVKRRNSGYALDALWDDHDKNGGVNLCKLLAGSEGTLCVITEVKLSLMDLPPAHVALVAVHCHSLREALQANLTAVQHGCAASELVDDMILGFARSSPRYAADAAFVQGTPKALLLVEFMEDNPLAASNNAKALIHTFTNAGIGYAFPVLYNEQTRSAWELRKAGLGLIRNLPGDEQPINLIEDGAVAVEDLPAYVDEVTRLLERYGLRYCIYAHAGPGELHIEPILNLKTTVGRKLLRTIAMEAAQLIKKYRGSLSGEHGDGRLRGEFIPLVMGEEVYALFRQLKNTFDPKQLFNRNKILDTPPMDTHLRVELKSHADAVRTNFDFGEEGSMLRLAEKCSGSGDCRRSAISGGLMCPSYMATRAEKDTTRARANLLRQFLTENSWSHKASADEVMSILDLCLSCKGCKTECPSYVDVTKLKAEFTQQYHDRYGIPFRSRFIGRFAAQMKAMYPFRQLYNAIISFSPARRAVNSLLGFHPGRTLPAMASTKLTERYKRKNADQATQGDTARTVHFFVDEFTEYTDAPIAEKAIQLMEKLGYRVIVHGLTESGRALLSKGLLHEAGSLANKNIQYFSAYVNEQEPLVGIEPSAILSFRDEYLSLVDPGLRAAAKNIAPHCLSFTEWVYREMKEGRIHAGCFGEESVRILLHEHCHQKALGQKDITKEILSLPVHYAVETIPSGCCGMAGAFGYEKEHYDLSMQIGELVLFPRIRSAETTVIVAASGTSCRHQIWDGTGKRALHPAEILFSALRQ